MFPHQLRFGGVELLAPGRGCLWERPLERDLDRRGFQRRERPGDRDRERRDLDLRERTRDRDLERRLLWEETEPVDRDGERNLDEEDVEPEPPSRPLEDAVEDELGLLFPLADDVDVEPGSSLCLAPKASPNSSNLDNAVIRSSAVWPSLVARAAKWLFGASSLPPYTKYMT